MAHKKGQGSTRNGRRSLPQYRGVKKYVWWAKAVIPWQILIANVATKWHPGKKRWAGQRLSSSPSSKAQSLLPGDAATRGVPVRINVLPVVKNFPGKARTQNKKHPQAAR
ncbi:UNVERIFIED_CONTAM: hypothetical protein GTU68_001108 [Idotea baltica]|nr:hypothetical protein [Idotea baltica]